MVKERSSAETNVSYPHVDVFFYPLNGRDFSYPDTKYILVRIPQLYRWLGDYFCRIYTINDTTISSDFCKDELFEDIEHIEKEKGDTLALFKFKSPPSSWGSILIKDFKVGIRVCEDSIEEFLEDNECI
jgi:hypothetical protein